MTGRGEPFIGRDGELRRLATAFEGSLAGRGRLVRIVGEPGIGKTRLARESADIAAAGGAKVAWGRCWESGGAPAFWPWMQIVRALGRGEATFAARAATSVAEAEEARFGLFDAMARLLIDGCREQPSFLIFDDAHAADVPSLLFLQFVARQLPALRLVIVITHREVEARMRPEVSALLAKVAREGETIFPRRLDEANIAAWLNESGRPVNTAASVHRVTEGNPLFVRELLDLPPEHCFDVAGSDTVHSAIAEHIARLSPGARRTLELAAVLGRESKVRDVAALSQSRLPALSPQNEDTRSSAFDAHVREGEHLGIVDARAGCIAFRHVLYRDAIYANTDPTARTALHARAAEVYSEHGDAGDDDALAPAAHHSLLAAATTDDAARAVARARRAATVAVERAAYEEAATLLERAIGVGEATGIIPSPGLLIDWGEALMLSGFGPRGRDVCARAAALAKARDDEDSLVRAALVYGAELLTGSRDERMIALLRDALGKLDEQGSPLRARVMARLSSALVPSPKGAAEPFELAKAALEMVRRCGKPDDILFVLQFYVGSIGFRESTTERHAIIEETIAIAQSLDRPAALALALPWAICSDLEVANSHRSRAGSTSWRGSRLAYPSPVCRSVSPLPAHSLRWSPADLPKPTRDSTKPRSSSHGPKPHNLTTCSRWPDSAITTRDATRPHSAATTTSSRAPSASQLWQVRYSTRSA